jgi:hypothetical protein
MNPSKNTWYRTLFSISAVYDLVLGGVFTFIPATVFGALGIGDKLPAFTAYITLPGTFVMVIGIACAFVARGDFQRNASLILVCALYKLAYAATVIYYWVTMGLPHNAFGALAIADAIFFVLMLECFFSTRRYVLPEQ